MSNIDKIRQEIERLENEGAINKQKASENNDIESYVAWDQQEAVMGVLIRFIDSLQQEQPEVFDTIAFQKGVQEGRRLEREDIRQEIEQRYAYQKEMYNKTKPDGRPNDGWAESLAIMGELEELRTFLDALSEEPVLANLEEAAEEYLQKVKAGFLRTLEHPTAKDCFKAGAEWQYQKDRGEFARIKAKTWCEGFDAALSQFVKIPYMSERWFETTDGEFIAGAIFEEPIPADDVELYYRRRTRNDGIKQD